jgi:hypothetical protein
LTRRLRDAHALAARARSRERSDPRVARELYRKSLAIAADLPSALAGLSRCPPDPPSDLRAELVNDCVRLQWTAPAPDGLGPLTYVVLRKADSAFKHPADGVRIGEATGPEFEDRDFTPGTSASYAVLSNRSGVESAGAVAVGPIFLAVEVHDLRLETRHREIDLSWTSPSNTSEVRVVRKRGSRPTGPLDGDRIEALIDQAHDRGLEPDRVYHYGVFVVYRIQDGRAIASNGVFLSAQPHTQVNPLAAPSLTVEPEGRVTIKWVEPPRGIVKMIRTQQPFPHPPGVRLTPIDVASLDGEWLDVSIPDQTHDTPPPVPICYYTPLTSWGGAVTVGHSVAHSQVADPKDLRAARVGSGRINLRWSWSPQGHQSLVALRSGTPPTGPDDPKAHIETVLEADYARLGHFTMALPPSEPGPWHAAVYGMSNVAGHPVASPGLEPSARTLVPGTHPEIRVSYSIRRRLLAWRGASITLHTEPAGAEVPPTILVTNSRTVPLSADDGRVVAEFPASKDGSRLSLPRGLRLARLHARLFTDPRLEPNGSTPIQLQHPGAGEPRV